MSNKTGLKMGLGKWMIVLSLVIISVFASMVFSRLSRYSQALEDLSLSLSQYDRKGSEKGLESLKESYASFSNLGLQYFADKYLFKDMYKYEANIAHVNEDYEKAIDLLRGHDDDYEALNMRGVAKFRILYAAYHSEAAGKDQKIKEDILRRVLEEVKPDFENAVKKGPGPTYDFDSAYNYDLTSDPKLAKMALEAIRPPPRFILGIRVEGKGPRIPGRVNPDKRLDDPMPGSGDSRKKG